jgi:RHS repeat-associated protein
MVNDPASPTGFTFAYGTGGQVLSGVQGNDNTVTNTFDAVGRQLTSLVRDGATDRASYAYTYNRAGQVLSELADVGTDPADGTVSYGYDPLGRLTGSSLSGTTTAYGWDAATNRTSVQVGAGTPATTAYDDANRPVSGANPTAAYTSDADGRLTARPGQTMTHDHLGRLTAVKDASGTTTIAAYTYDPLDRLRTVDYGGGNRIRFRYTGTTTSAAQWIDDVAGTVTRSIGNGWGGEHLLDWTGTNSNRRTYGTNAHHDVTWTATDSGAILQSLRYDPWGTPRSAVPSGYVPFRFQGSWHDQATELAWVVTRWYAPSLGRFVSEDSLLGEPVNPGSRHLYAYGAGEPVGTWDPDGRIDYPNWILLKKIDIWPSQLAYMHVTDVSTVACLVTATWWLAGGCAAWALTLQFSDTANWLGAGRWERRWVYRSEDRRGVMFILWESWEVKMVSRVKNLGHFQARIGVIRDAPGSG